MIEAYGWAIARSSREEHEDASPDELDAIDERVAEADAVLFLELEKFLQQFEPPDLDWHFRSQLNNAQGILTLSSSRNHRGVMPTVVAVLHWLSQHGPASYGIVYLHDDEDFAAGAEPQRRDGKDHRNAFRVWRLCRGRVEEFDDPFLSPIVPLLRSAQD